ncbi:unnamed protein product [Rotaria sp. Silwood2]|nr:unnamed protein product [Rotaria sp. Silwood2]CAF4661748.1 unnamed protein product [Rotaria sp. Silwood2]
MANTNSNIFIEMAKSSQTRLGRTDFIYPLNCGFKVFGFNTNTNEYVVSYERRITVQAAGALNDGLKLHLSELPRRQRPYRLEATATDGKNVLFKSITSITLNLNGTVRAINERHLNTILLEIDNKQ